MTPRSAARMQLLAPLAALQLLTVVPVRLAAPTAAAVGYFPAVGALVGVAVGAFDALLQPHVAPALRAALDLLALAVLTGGLHLDGLADSADGLLAWKDRERRLAIMREPSIGSFGGIALIFVILVEWSALSQLSAEQRFGALVSACVLARWTMTLLLCLPSARPDGLGRPFRISWRSMQLAIASVFTVVVCAVAGRSAVALLIVAASTTGLIALFVRARIGGVTGDICGAAGELVFAASLVALATT
jgi:adenosylcobinamide-GDP ribazoletransferase